MQRTADETRLAARDRGLCRLHGRGRAAAARPARALSARARRAHAVALAREPAVSLRRAARSLRRSGVRRNVARLADYGWSFDLQVFAPQMASAARLARGLPARDLHPAARRHAGGPVARRGARHGAQGMVRLAACPNVVSKLSGARHFHPSQRSRAYRRRGQRDGGACSAPSGACSAPTFRSRSCGPAIATWSPPFARRPRRSSARASSDAIFCDHGASRVYRLDTSNNKKRREETMALEIKILDYGDIELESSFLVLGQRLRPHAARADARLPHPRRALSRRGRHRLSLQPDHGDARHARPAVSTRT